MGECLVVEQVTWIFTTQETKPSDRKRHHTKLKGLLETAAKETKFVVTVRRSKCQDSTSNEKDKQKGVTNEKKAGERGGSDVIEEGLRKRKPREER
jgi:uncharacterized membrane protein